MNNIRDLRLTYRMVPRNQEILLGKSSVEEVGDYSFVNIEYSMFHRLHRISKRLFDILGSVLILIVFSPLIVIKSIFSSTVSKEYWDENGERFDVLEFNNKNRFLRELLLLWAVLKGKISFVGSSLVDTTNPDPKLICKPGITGLARVRHVKNVSGENSIFDHYYVQNQSLTLDLEIIMKTLFS
jgi:lipopolysaccharide/colanic/teichoic acid biosynthesis glycosyltransferase